MKPPLFALVITLVALAAGGTPVTAADPPKVLFEENFSGKLSDGWQWLRERPEHWRIADESLIIDTLPGSNWANQNNGQNTLLRPLPAGASLQDGFMVEVHLDNSPRGQFENSGILCYFDGQTFVCMNKEAGGPHQSVFVFSQQNAKPTFSKDKEYRESGIWLRLIMHGGKAIGQFRSTEQEPWQTVGECPIPSSSKELLVGLKSWYGQEPPVRHATFRSFRILKAIE